MFQFRPFASISYVFRYGYTGFASVGFPIRKSPDQSLVGSSPELTAASDFLHRLLMPRHPPNALFNYLQVMIILFRAAFGYKHFKDLFLRDSRSHVGAYTTCFSPQCKVFQQLIRQTSLHGKITTLIAPDMRLQGQKERPDCVNSRAFNSFQMLVISNRMPEFGT